MYKAYYLDEVENDITAAKYWYAEQQENLDNRFTSAVKEAITNILQMPFAFAVRYKNVRIAHTKIFPYNIHYFVDEIKQHIVIIGIVHSKRSDALCLDRL